VVERAALSDYETLVDQVAREKGLDKQAAVIHAAPLFYARYGVKPGDLKRKAGDYQWQLEVEGVPGEASKGGPGSGHRGHAGRPGKVGGSAPGKGGGEGPASYDSGDDEMLFGDWACDLRTGDLRGYRGVNTSGYGFGSTEGKGVYISMERELAQWFAGDEGQVKKVKFAEPKKPLFVNNEELYLLSESDALEEPPKKSDSPWLAANKWAVAEAYKETGGKWDMDLAADYLTKRLKAQGYDSVLVRSGGEQWVVLFDAGGIKDAGDEFEWQLELKS